MDEAEPKQRLLDAAERLIALHGREGVSAREIVRAAGHRNNSAIEYHFGGLEELVDALWRRGLSETDRRTAACMDRLEREGRAEDPHSLIEAMVMPIVAQMKLRQPSYWARFGQRWSAPLPLDFLTETEAHVATHVGAEVTGWSRMIGELLAVTAELTGESATCRVAMVCRFVTNELAAWERDAEAGLMSMAELDRFAAQVIDAATAIAVGER